MPARRKARSVDGESGRLDDMRLDAEARAEAQNRSRVLRNVGFIEGDAHELEIGR